MKKLFELQKEIYEILKEIPITRTDDHLLYVSYWRKKRPDVSFVDFWQNYKKYKVSGFAGVERCRRKLQERYPELKDVETAEARLEETMKYENYAING